MERLDYLALQIIQAIQYISSGFNEEMVFTDHVLLETPSGREMFPKNGQFWFIRNDSIPGDPSLKAIAFDKNNVYLETSDIDLGLAKEVMSDRDLDGKIDPNSRTIFSSKGVKLLQFGKSVTPNVDGEDLEPRITITIPLQDTNLRGVKLVDALWSGGAFVSTAEDEYGANSGSQKIELRLDLNLRLQLKLEQRPILLVQTKTVPKGDTVQRTELQLQSILSMQTALLKLSKDELEKKVSEIVASHGEKEAIKVLDFVLAGKVKKLLPHLTWKEAREIAKKATNKVAI